MLGRLDRAPLDLLDQGAARTELAARGEFDVDLTVGGIFDIILEIPLHDRIFSGCPEDIGGGHIHRELGCFLALRILFSRRGCSFRIQRNTAAERGNCSSEADFCT